LKREFPELLSIKESLIKYVFEPNCKTSKAWEMELHTTVCWCYLFHLNWHFSPGISISTPLFRVQCIWLKQIGFS
jgi:hypothetical protein